MSVRHSLLAILAQGPCYGYQLRTEFERRTGGAWPLNVGQIYHTLDRLERDGLVATAGSDQAGHVFYAITPAGRHDAERWLSTPAERPAAPARDELAIKLALAATLPGVDVAAALGAQREASERAQAELEQALQAAEGADTPEALASALVLDARLQAAQAELRWLARAQQRLAEASSHGSAGIPLAAHPPKRGRPRRVHQPTGSGFPSS